ncbi:Cerato-ulmin hydrophobin family [Cladorrhinum sp. PSN259]|nr:Cerato-ulmin hydrophobin family [Cladorrhinum sp. PSN259]
MKFAFAAVTALCAAFVNALPAPEVEARQVPYIPCAGTYANAQCCATDVLGLADLDCANPPAPVANATEFQAVCSDIGQRARCCAIPILGQALLCSTPAGLPTKI